MKTWWQWAEYISVALTVIALIIFLSIGWNSLLYIMMTITIILNTFNLWHLEKRTKNRLAATLNIQTRRFGAKLEQVKQTLDSYIMEQRKIIITPQISDDLPQSDNEIIAAIQEDLTSLNQSLLTVINYLQEEEIEVRIKNLETLYESRQASGQRHQGESSLKVELPDANILSQNSELNLEPAHKIAWRCIHLIDAHQDAVTDLGITNDRYFLFTVSRDNYLKLWSLETGQEIAQVMASESGLSCLALERDNWDGGVITGSIDQELKIWSWERETDSFILKHNLQEHQGSIHALALAMKKKIIVSGSFDANLKQWDLFSGDLLYSSLNEHGGINAMAINESIDLIVAGSDDGIITMWELDGEKCVGLLLGNQSSLKSLAISQSGRWIAAGCHDGSIKIWQLPTTIFSVFLEVTPYMELIGHQDQVMDLIFTSNEDLLYSGSIDGFVKIWHLPTTEEIGHLKISEDDQILSLALSQDEQILAVGGMEGVVKIWQQHISS